MKAAGFILRGMLVLIAAVVGVLVYVPAYTNSAPPFVSGESSAMDHVRPVPEIARRSVTYVRLADEKSHPFPRIASGKNGLAHTLAMFWKPTVRSCLTLQERWKPTPDLRQFSWYTMHTEALVEVCIHRVVASLGSAEEAKSWLAQAGYPRIVERKSKQGDQRVAHVVEAYRLIDRETGPRWPAYGFRRWFAWTLVLSEGVRLEWDADGNLRDVSLPYTIL